MSKEVEPSTTLILQLARALESVGHDVVVRALVDICEDERKAIVYICRKHFNQSERAFFQKVRNRHNQHQGNLGLKICAYILHEVMRLKYNAITPIVHKDLSTVSRYVTEILTLDGRVKDDQIKLNHLQKIMQNPLIQKLQEKYYG